MTVFIVGYDLKRPVQNYTKLIDAIEASGGKKILLSNWILNVNQTAEALLEALRSFGDGNDLFFAIEVPLGADWDAYAMKAGVNYLQSFRA